MSFVNGTVSAYQGGGAGTLANDLIVVPSAGFAAGSSNVRATGSADIVLGAPGTMTFDINTVTGTDIVVTSPGVYTVNTTGVYMVAATIAGTVTPFSIFINGAVAPGGVEMYIAGGTSLVQVYSLAAGDVVTCRSTVAGTVFCEVGGKAYSVFQITRLS